MKPEARSAGQTEPIGQAEVAHAVQDAVVDHLGHAPIVVRDLLDVEVEHLGRGRRVGVLALGERLEERRVAREMRQHAQLDLAVVGREQQLAWLGGERPPHALALVGADRDVLQVGVARAQPTGRGAGLVEGRVDTSGVRVDQHLEGVDVGRLQLLRAGGAPGSAR